MLGMEMKNEINASSKMEMFLLYVVCVNGKEVRGKS